jgi:hypothetical protein
MPATPDARALHAGMHRIEQALQLLFDEAAAPGAGPATVTFEWKGGQPGGDIPVSEAVTLEASSPGGNGRLVLRQDAVEASANGVQPDVQAELKALAGRMAGR